MTVQNEMTSRCFVKAGGIWGDAFWKRVNPSTIISIGGSTSRDSSLHNDDFLMAPTDETECNPVCLRVYYDVDSAYDVTVGEAPECDEYISMTFANLHECLFFIDRTYR